MFSSNNVLVTYLQSDEQYWLVTWYFPHVMNVVVGVFVYLPKEDATVFAEVQGVAVLLLHRIMFLQGEVH